MKKAPVVEIFQSLQGEGVFAGVRQVFVRFYDCNMNCVWCDTPESHSESRERRNEYTAHELFYKTIEKYDSCHSVSLTGGEPLLHSDFLKDFLPLLKKTGLRTYLETNGILHEQLKEIISDIDFIAMDIKLPSSTKCEPHWREHLEFLKTACHLETFIKVTISSETALEDIVRAVELVASINKDMTFILQPNSFELNNGVLRKCFDFQDICVQCLNDVRIIPQIHKLLELR